MPALIPLFIIIGIILLVSIRQINQYERGISFTMGRFNKVKNPGWRLVIPVFQSMKKVDIRTKAVDVPDQDAITKDNIPIKINAVIYYSISNPEKAILEVENYFWAMSQMAQTTMRNAIGETMLDTLLQKRDEISQSISKVIDTAAASWGIKVESLELKDIVIPEELKRVISKVAEAEREKRSVIIKAEGDKMASDNLADAARTLSSVPGAMHLRTLSTINSLASDKSNTTIWMVPIDVLEAVRGFENVLKKGEVSTKK